MNKAQQHRSEYLYEQHLIHLTLQGKRPATIDAYSRALRRITHQLDKSPDNVNYRRSETVFYTTDQNTFMEYRENFGQNNRRSIIRIMAFTLQN